MPELQGKDFVALVRLSTADDGTLAVAGETCERVPASALEWLLQSRLIRRHASPVEEPVSAPAPLAAPAGRLEEVE